MDTKSRPLLNIRHPWVPFQIDIMKKVILFGIFLCTFSNWLTAQIPEEEVRLASVLSRLNGEMAATPQNIKNVDVFGDDDITWVVKANHIRGNKFELTVKCELKGDKHIGSKDQPPHPWGKVYPTRIFIASRDNIQLKGTMTEKGKIKLHKCSPNHKCIKDHDRRVYGAVYRQVFKVKHARKYEKYYISGMVDWRLDTDSTAGIPKEHGFILVFGIF
jgi:hypothetical protein